MSDPLTAKQAKNLRAVLLAIVSLILIATGGIIALVIVNGAEGQVIGVLVGIISPTIVALTTYLGVSKQVEDVNSNLRTVEIKADDNWRKLNLPNERSNLTRENVPEGISHESDSTKGENK